MFVKLCLSAPVVILAELAVEVKVAQHALRNPRLVVGVVFPVLTVLLCIGSLFRGGLRV